MKGGFRGMNATDRLIVVGGGVVDFAGSE